MWNSLLIRGQLIPLALSSVGGGTWVAIETEVPDGFRPSVCVGLETISFALEAWNTLVYSIVASVDLVTCPKAIISASAFLVALFWTDGPGSG